MKTSSKKNLYILLLILSIPLWMALALSLRSGFVLAKAGQDSLLQNFLRNIFFDYQWRWAECRYMAAGVNPIDVITGNATVIDSIGPLSEIAGAFPWAYFVGYMLTFAMLPYPQAQIGGMAFFAFLAFAGAIYFYKNTRLYTGSSAVGIWTALFFLATPCFYHAFAWGNYGFLSGVLIIVACLESPKHPLLAGILMAIASVKPQLAALFYLALLLNRQIKTVLIGTAGVFLSWGAAAMLCHTSPLLMLKQTFEQSTNSFAETCYFGLFTGILPRQTGMFLSMAICCIAELLLCLYLLSQKNKTSFFPLLYYSVPAIFSLAWTYSNNFDASVLMIFYLAVICMLYRIWQQGRFGGLLLLVVFQLLLLWLAPEYPKDCFAAYWDCYIPGSFTDAFAVNNLLLFIRMTLYAVTYKELCTPLKK